MGRTRRTPPLLQYFRPLLPPSIPAAVVPSVPAVVTAVALATAVRPPLTIAIPLSVPFPVVAHLFAASPPVEPCHSFLVFVVPERQAFGFHEVDGRRVSQLEAARVFGHLAQLVHAGEVAAHEIAAVFVHHHSLRPFGRLHRLDEVLPLGHGPHFRHAVDALQEQLSVLVQQGAVLPGHGGVFVQDLPLQVRRAPENHTLGLQNHLPPHVQVRRQQVTVAPKQLRGGLVTVATTVRARRCSLLVVRPFASAFIFLVVQCRRFAVSARPFRVVLRLQKLAPGRKDGIHTAGGELELVNPKGVVCVHVGGGLGALRRNLVQRLLRVDGLLLLVARGLAPKSGGAAHKRALHPMPVTHLGDRKLSQVIELDEAPPRPLWL
mmetsp:Transcript_10984/g.26909  ORF Transcript_10984/g.26909 Transcript_10984/m.26909 type:complete len:377 (-) Transcript_10984:67-1197(-)